MCRGISPEEEAYAGIAMGNRSEEILGWNADKVIKGGLKNSKV
jgi:hypothetical protein